MLRAWSRIPSGHGMPTFLGRCVKALILAAGRGERLRPLTDECPKPMIEIGGKPILQRNIELLVGADVCDIIINLHYCPDAITRYFGDGHAFGAKIQYVYEDTLLGTAGAARNVAGFLRDQDFVVVYGDNLAALGLTKMLELHRVRGATMTMALYHREDPRASGIVALGPDDRITRFLEKPTNDEIFSHWVNAGYYVASPEVLDAIPETMPADFGRDVLPVLLRDGAGLYGYRMTEQLWWIDSIEDYEYTQRHFRD